MDRSTTFTMSERDLLVAGRRSVYFSLTDRRTMGRLVLLWLTALALSIVLFMALRPGRYELLDIVPIAALIATLAAFIVPVLVPLITLPIVTKRRYQQDAMIRRPLTMSWTDTHFRAETEGVTNNLPWVDYVKWCEDKDQFLFFLSDYNYQILPKRVLSGAQIEDVRSAVQTARA